MQKCKNEYTSYVQASEVDALKLNFKSIDGYSKG